MHQDCHSVWNNCLRFIKAGTSDQSFRTWFMPIVPLKLVDGVLTIQVPSQFFYEWLEEHYVHLLRSAIDQVLGTEGRLEYSVIVDQGSATSQPYTVKYPEKKSAPQSPSGNGAFQKNGMDKGVPMQEASAPKPHNPQLNPSYTFETFVEGDCNRLGRSAGYAVAQKPGVTSFNPLMVYGGVGLGKTHLVQAIGNEIQRNLPGKRVYYVSSEKFTNQFIEALRNNRVQDFSNFFLDMDVLILDDVQFLANKEKTQEIFFHIFNHLHQSGKQIIMTSDCPPRDLRGLQERLLSRFKWGLTADLQQPDLETRIAIIQNKMQSDGIDIPDDVIEYLAYSVDTNIRELEGVIISLIAHASLNRREIDLELAKQCLKHIVSDIETEVGIDFIQKTVSEYFNISLENMKAKTRKKEIVIARQVAMYFCKEYTNHSLKSIGFHFGGRDHSTVIHAVQSVNDMVTIDPKMKNAVEALKKKLRVRVTV